ncbi:MAG: GH3 auxin-responsive promoter family protein [Bacteroides sp.]|nr:GH3 auxin-responsive promoter family protein [Bacteroides sp.]
MIDFTPLVRPWFLRKDSHLESWRGATRRVQLEQLRYLLSRGAATKWGAARGLDSPAAVRSLKEDSLPELLSRVQPRVQSYPDIRADVMRMVDGEKSVLWPGVTRRFAQSSGTSDGKSKYIPITDDSLRLNHYAGGTLCVARYLRLHPESRLFGGKSFILGGSYANELDLPAGVKVGDLSATLIDRINPLANLARIPSKSIALLTDWNVKLPALIRASLREDVRSISGVPSWFLTVLKGVIEQAGADNIHDVWPNLEVFFHGGISMEPYREQYAHITRPGGMNYLETYNASEGFFAVQDSLESRAMALLVGSGIYFEFIPLADADNPDAKPLAPWETEPGKVYSLVITAPNGLWRYTPGDTVRVESLEPLRITVAGRTHSFINAFGEELMVENAEAAMSRVCREMGCTVVNYTAAPVYAGDHSRGRHEWLIEFDRPPASTEEFADRLDRALQDVNSDYQAKRSGGIFLDRLSIVEGRRGVFEQWLASTGKLGGQRKVPRLSNNRATMDTLLRLNGSPARH